MQLTPGTRVGPFEIVAPLGAGGMGEVYRARDTRLGREVAIKALPAAFAQDPERLARFEREAKLLASLSHPNIAGIHGLEEAAGARYLVLEFVEGETLAERLAGGALPVDEAIDTCRQVAAGVEAAHESGVVHRDLKPGNIMITPSGAVKVLDFGLAKGGAGSPSSPAAGLSASPTLTHAATAAGVILGTAAYMSPEQARGRAVDRRTDVWSFGCVLYECLTGRQAYEGETVSDLIARILEREPDWSALPPLPARVRELLHRCLTKDVTQRLRDIGEARVTLAAPGAAAVAPDPHAGAPVRSRWLAPAVAAVLAIAATAAVFLAVQPRQAAGPVRRFRIPIDGLRTAYYSPLALTHDGRQLAYEAKGSLWLRRLDQLDAVEIPGSKGGATPFWSWDQRTLGFAANKKLWRYEPGADRSVAICDIPESGNILGAAWGPDARIAFAVWRGALYEVPAAGGEVKVLLALDSTQVDFHGPSYLPDGHTLLMLVHDGRKAEGVATFGGSPPRLTPVYEDAGAGLVSYSPTGHLLLTREDAAGHSRIWAVPFSASSRKVTGPAFLVLDGASRASDSDNGLLVAADDREPPQGQLIWKRRGRGGEEVIGAPQQGLSAPALSPDGARVAYVAIQDENADIWVQDLVRGTRTRLTSAPASEGNPMWSPDGSRIYYSTSQGVGSDAIVATASDGSGASDTLARGIQVAPSPDGRSLVCTIDRRGNSDLWWVPLGGGGAAKEFLATASNEESPSISPDSHWIAYASDESGQLEIYIRRYPEGDMRAQVSVGGGSWPRWTRRGDAIYYVNADTVSIVSVSPGPRPALGLPRALFTTVQSEDLALSARRVAGFPLDEHPDGTRFIGVRRTESPAVRTVTFVENWLAEFRKPR